MSYIAKVIVATTLSAGAIGGASYAGYHQLTKVSFADKLSVSVLKLTGTDNEKEWGFRLKELGEKTTDLDSNLATLKGKTWQQLRDWCSNNSSNRFTEETDIIYKNFEEFCTWKVGDKLTTKIEAEVGDSQDPWGKAHQKLKRVTNKNTLSSELQTVYDEKSADSADKKAMHNWCIASYKKTWVGEDDQVFKETQEYCKKD